MKPLNPLFYFFLFLEATVLFPVVINGFRVVNVWYCPMSDTGQTTFITPFLDYVFSFLAVSLAVGFVLLKKKGSRFILVRGPMRVKSVIKAVLKDKVGLALVSTYFSLYYLSYLVTSGILLVPGLNVDRYFVQLTLTTYEGAGFAVSKLGWFYLVIEPSMMLIGIAVDAVLTVSLILSYYVISLIYVSTNLYSFPIPKSFRLSATSTAGGFLTASVPSIGTIAGICCLTPTAMNSLLYLASGALPLTKGVAWKYGTFVLGAWTGGLIQALALGSTVFAGALILGVSAYYVMRISKRLAERYEVMISG